VSGRVGCTHSRGERLEEATGRVDYTHHRGVRPDEMVRSASRDIIAQVAN
jgi:hypothetical protein